MDKNWLIRTKSNHILGPISKEKVQEIYRNGSIRPDDEICSGNGFWFYLREDDMVNRYLLGEESQGFNPISEAKDVLTITEVPTEDFVFQKDHITLVGGIPLSMLKDDIPSSAPPAALSLETALSSLQDEAAAEVIPPPLTHQDVDGAKKKTKKLNSTAKVQALHVRPPKENSDPTGTTVPKKQSYLKWVGIAGFILLFCLIYFRKKIIRAIFDGEVTSSLPSFISTVHAQESLEEKKKLLDRSIVIDKITFGISVGLGGLKVVSSLDINDLECSDLSNEVRQLGVVLHPPELFNEKFLIRMRECVLKLQDTHPLKRWLRTVSAPISNTKNEQEKVAFLTEVLNSQFNLITDQGIRTQIINALLELSEKHLGERLLKSYLYLIIGNVTKSDSILKDFVKRAPFVNWQGFMARPSLYAKLAEANIEQIIVKIANHPTDRKAYQLLTAYLQSYYNDERLLRLLGENQKGDELNIWLRHTERFAPELTRHLRLSRKSSVERNMDLQKTDVYHLREQAHWNWPFLPEGLNNTDMVLAELKKLEEEERLLFLYLMEDEKLIDAYSKKMGRAFKHGQRQYLRSLLENKNFFMLALFKLIQMGDIDADLVNKTVDFTAYE
jgi:hypothetical protein